ncbi:2OG-Fe(II) oxygenase [Acetobacter conturbans]|uniref:Prolyl 4-hydroxylase alpha subunit Fe(2+) 2OG dioxygenase domain-containing protein n=1 Tax=Acetobacter conturbans TaxID=1737472 RepID=A0ABX0K056_9PROT|nr:2OG-Fe(II) oxygenase [Acetobacter conturbans]NHN88489.1 hypothetical protein [Acetobacter conturbans]
MPQLQEELCPDWNVPSPADITTLNREFREAKPFPYLVLDNLFDRNGLTQILHDTESASELAWEPHYTRLQRKRVARSLPEMPPSLARYFALTHSPDFMNCLEKLTGLSGLQSDASLFGGGLHEADPDGHFEIHLDFQTHPVTRLSNALVVITYLNPDWQEGKGGELELWNAVTRKPEAKVAPLFGRTLIMSQSKIALHGYPRPLASGKRRALITYFYTRDKQDSQKAMYNTHYLRRPGLPLDRHIQMVMRDYLPKPLVTTLRRARSHLVHQWRERKGGSSHQ